MIDRRIFAIVTSLLLAGCATTSFAPARVGERYPPRARPEQIELYRSQTPTRPFAEIGTTSVCCLNDVEKSIQFLRDKASREGGDALMALEVTANGATIATVIRYKDGPLSGPVPVPGPEAPPRKKGE